MSNFKYQVSICAMYRNEGKYLQEWLEYYLILGVEHFYLYNNLSDDNHLAILTPYCQKGLVTYHEYPVEISNKSVHSTLDDPNYPYTHCVQNYKNDNRWIGFLDLDEFVVIYSNQRLPDFMKNYENYSGLAIHWLCFGSSSHYLEPEGLVVENYTLRPIRTHPHNVVVKSILNPRDLVKWNNVHLPIVKSVIVREDKTICPLHHDVNILHDKIALFHYRRKSKWYNIYRKMGRGIHPERLKTQTVNSHIKHPQSFAEFHYGDSTLWEQTNTLAWNCIQDLTMQKMIPQLNRQLNLTSSPLHPLHQQHLIIDYQHYLDTQPGIYNYVNDNLLTFKNQILSLIHHHWMVFNNCNPGVVRLIPIQDVVKKFDVQSYNTQEFRDWLATLSDQLIQSETQSLIRIVPPVKEIIYFPKPTELVTLNEAIINKYLLDYAISVPSNFNLEVYLANGPPLGKLSKYQAIQHWLEVGRYQNRTCI